MDRTFLGACATTSRPWPPCPNDAGCRAHMLLYLATGLPLSMLPQMALQTVSLALIVALRRDCQKPVR